MTRGLALSQANSGRDGNRLAHFHKSSVFRVLNDVKRSRGVAKVGTVEAAINFHRLTQFSWAVG
jgi:hypothetical protein